MFKPVIERRSDSVTVSVNGIAISVPSLFTAASAVLSVGMEATRSTPISAAPRAPYCMMGICFECLMEIDGVPNQQACLIPVAEGMRINFQNGARSVVP